MKLLFITLFLFFGEASNKESAATEFYGKVIKIVDGDTFDILLDNNSTKRIRMAGIDAPEKRMPFYQKSKDYLGALCFGKIVRIKKTDTDRNGRWIAQTFTDSGKELGLLMVTAGYAWHYKKYSSDSDLAKAEKNAQKKKLGLWADKFPVAPWDWRKKT